MINVELNKQSLSILTIARSALQSICRRYPYLSGCPTLANTVFLSQFCHYDFVAVKRGERYSEIIAALGIHGALLLRETTND